SRIVTQVDGTVCYDADFTPFGAERAYTNSCATANNYKFEGKERDAETQNDDFGARYYTWRFGRWLSADWSNVPAPVPYANLTNPQTLNLYSMVSDDPESFADLDGHTCPPDCASQEQATDLGKSPNTGPGGSNNPANAPGLDTIQKDFGQIAHAEGGKVSSFYDTTEISTTTSAGFLQVNSTGSISLQAIPGAGQTVDVTFHAPEATPNRVGISGGTPFVSANVTTNSVTVSGGFVLGPPVKAGANVSVDAKATIQNATPTNAARAASSLASGLKGLFSTIPSAPRPLPPPPPPACTTSGCKN